MIKEQELKEFIGRKFIHPIDLTEVERTYAISLEYDNQVASYFPAKMEIQAKDEPDEVFLKINFWVVYNNLLERLIHIHDEKFNMTLWDGALKNTSDLTVCFTPVPVEKVMREPRRSNLELLWNHSEGELRMEYFILLTEFFKLNEISTIEKLRQYFKEAKLDDGLVFFLIFHRVIICQVENFAISNKTLILLSPCLEPGDEWKRDVLDQMTFF